jgi:hypothetical protein
MLVLNLYTIIFPSFDSLHYFLALGQSQWVPSSVDGPDAIGHIQEMEGAWGRWGKLQ